MFNKINPKAILLLCYIIVLLFVGVFNVPSYAEWGPEKNIYSYEYTHIFDLVKDHVLANGFEVFYRVDIIRLLYTVGIVTLITISIWKLITIWEQHRKNLKDSEEM